MALSSSLDHLVQAIMSVASDVTSSRADCAVLRAALQEEEAGKMAFANETAFVCGELTRFREEQARRRRGRAGLCHEASSLEQAALQRELSERAVGLAASRPSARQPPHLPCPRLPTAPRTLAPLGQLPWQTADPPDYVAAGRCQPRRRRRRRRHSRCRTCAHAWVRRRRRHLATRS